MSQRILWVLLLLSAFLLFVPLPYPALAEGPHRAGLIVVYGPDNVYSTCVTFSEAELPGTELLRRAGLRVVGWALPGQGEAICKIGSTGCDYPGEECFCQCLSTPCRYWSYWYWQNGQWIYSGRGAGSRMVRDGNIDAWVWGDGNSQPPAISSGLPCGGVAAPTATVASQEAYPGPTESPARTRSLATRMPSATTTTVPAQGSSSTSSGSAPVTLPATTPKVLGPYPGEATSTPLVVPVASQMPQLAYPQATQAVTAPASGAVSTTAYPEEERISGSPATTSTADVVMMSIATSAAESRAIPTATPPGKRSVWGGYGAFGILVVVLLLLIGYATLVRRRQQKRPG